MHNTIFFFQCDLLSQEELERLRQEMARRHSSEKISENLEEENTALQSETQQALKETVNCTNGTDGVISLANGDFGHSHAPEVLVSDGH